MVSLFFWNSCLRGSVFTALGSIVPANVRASFGTKNGARCLRKAGLITAVISSR